MSSSAPSPLHCLVNFCTDPFVASVRCEAVTADGYSPHNLVTKEPHLRSRGVRVEHFIRPPVAISIELCVPVSVSCILLCPDLPEHAELTVELSGGFKNTEGAQYRLCPRPMVGTSGSLLVGRRSKQSRTQEMASVTDLANLVMHSRGCKELTRFEHIESSLKNMNVLWQLKHLQLKVTRWTGPKPVSIKWLEIWGVVSTACSRQERAQFQSKWNAALRPKPSAPPPEVYGSGQCSVSSAEPEGIPPSSSDEVAVGVVERNCRAAASSLPHEECKEEIPEQFLDELTFELMVLPVLLPSGHCVDQSSVDRLAHNDALYGRAPTDPFTGLQLALHSHAVLNTV